MKVLVVGYGSIGRRHYEILSNIDEIDEVHVVTRQTVDEIVSFPKLSEVDVSDYDYFVISTETSRHFADLSYICSKVSGRKILVEKPIFDRLQEVDLNSNEVRCAYNMRFNPVISWLKEKMVEQKPLCVNIICGQYLPYWRPDSDYRKSYSASRELGGGVLRDLSHELDYLMWIWGKIVTIDSINDKISELEIDSDDIFTAVGRTEHGTIFNITIDYLNRKGIRKIIVNCDDATFDADVIRGDVIISGEHESLMKLSYERDDMYKEMHTAFISGDYENLCSYDEAIEIMKIIDKKGMR